MPCSQPLISPNFLLITSIFTNTPSLPIPGALKRDYWRNPGHTGAENTVELHEILWAYPCLPKVPQWRLCSKAQLHLALQRAKLIPRVLFPTAELLPTRLAQQFHLKINNECVSKHAFYTDDLLFLSTAEGQPTVYDCSNLLSLLPLLSHMHFLL